MKKWAMVTTGLYAAALLALTVPVCMIALAPDLSFAESLDVFQFWPYWALIVVVVVAQALLLLTRVKAETAVCKAAARRWTTAR